jgi:hypothetical protein
MKNPDRKTVSRLEDLPNIGKAMADDLRLIGIDHPKKLIGKDPLKLYDKLCRAIGVRQDACVIDVFISVVHYMEGGEPRPWWSFTEERKNRLLCVEETVGNQRLNSVPLLVKARKLRARIDSHQIIDDELIRAKNAGRL